MRCPGGLALGVGVVSVLCASASAQYTMTFLWDINETGSDTFVYAQEPVLNFKLYAFMEPLERGFAGSAYDILGGDEFATAGVVTLFDNKLDDLTDDGELQGNNDILGVESFQLPPLFNPAFREWNPILLYEFEYEVLESFERLTVTTEHINADVYLDEFGTMVPYEAVPTVATVVIPAPGLGAVVVSCAGVVGRRRCVGAATRVVRSMANRDES